MKSVIFLIAFIIIDDLITVLGQDYIVDYSDERNPHSNVYRSVDKLTGKRNHTVNPNWKKDNPFSSMVRNSDFKEGRIVECRGMSSKIQKMVKEVLCRPRKTLVKLSSDPGYSYIPDVILIDRCDGRCGHESQSCMPTESTTTKVLVQRMQIGSLNSPCYELEVEKHTKCKCGCDLMARDCNARQKYIEDECTCECSNIREQLDCTLKDGMYWNKETCRCSCLMEEETCSTGLMWIPSICRCAKVMMGN